MRFKSPKISVVRSFHLKNYIFNNLSRLLYGKKTIIIGFKLYSIHSWYIYVTFNNIDFFKLKCTTQEWALVLTFNIYFLQPYIVNRKFHAWSWNSIYTRTKKHNINFICKTYII